MMTLPKGGDTLFEKAVIQLRVLVVCLDLAQGYASAPDHDVNVHQHLLDDLLDRFDSTCSELEGVYASLLPSSRP